MKPLKICLFVLGAMATATPAIAAETPLCVLPPANTNIAKDSSNAEDVNPSCPQILNAAKKIAATTQSNVPLANATSIPPQLSVGAVYLQPITMAPAGMMLPRNQSDIHLEMDIHAKTNLKARGFGTRGLATECCGQLYHSENWRRTTLGVWCGCTPLQLKIFAN